MRGSGKNAPNLGVWPLFPKRKGRRGGRPVGERLFEDVSEEFGDEEFYAHFVVFFGEQRFFGFIFGGPFVRTVSLFFRVFFFFIVSLFCVHFSVRFIRRVCCLAFRSL